MGQPYVGEIRMFGGSFAPAGWAFCNGQIMPISENETLFNLIGTTYGGDGQETFALPNLQGRIPMHTGNGYILAETGGTESVTLTTNQIPVHTHPVTGSSATADAGSPENNIFGSSVGFDAYFPDPEALTFNSSALTPVGGSQPHENMAPFLAVSFIISLYGIFPSPT